MSSSGSHEHLHWTISKGVLFPYMKDRHNNCTYSSMFRFSCLYRKLLETKKIYNLSYFDEPGMQVASFISLINCAYPIPVLVLCFIAVDVDTVAHNVHQIKVPCGMSLLSTRMCR